MEEKKNVTKEERKEIKAKLKNKFDKLSDEELDKVVGGLTQTEDGQWICILCGKKFHEYDLYVHLEDEHHLVSWDFLPF